MGERTRETPADAKAFADTAVEKGYLTASQAADIIETHRKVAELGLPEQVSVIAVKKGFMTEEQARAAKRALVGAHRIAGYEIMEKIGQGSMGAVFKARQLSMERTIALKILPPKVAENKAFIESFMREARAVAKLNHINIIQGIDVGKSGDYYYFAMEYVDGPTVKQLLKDKTRLPEREALSIVMQVARALEHAWKHGMVHRDVKPDNIMITSTSIAKLCDLGLVKRPDDDASERSGVAVGTPYYISPEQARGESDVDIRSDIYSLGATLYHMVTGLTPFEGTSAAIVMTKHLTEVVPNPQDRVSELSDGLSLIIEMMMAKDRQDRYQNPTELLRDIELVMDKKEPKHAKQFKGESSIMPAVARRRRAKATQEAEAALRKIPTGALIAGAGAALAVIAVLIALVVSMRKGPEKPPDQGPAPVTPVVEAHPPTQGATGSQSPAAQGESAQAARAKEMFDYAMEQASRSPADYDGNIDKLTKVARETRGTVYSMKAEDEVKRLEAERDSKTQAAFDSAKAAAEPLAEKGEFGRALDAWNAFPEPMRRGKHLKDFTEACQAVRKAADDHWTSRMKEADAAASQAKFRDAEGTIKALASMGLPETPEKVAKALEALAKREESWNKADAARAAGAQEKLGAEAQEAFFKLVQADAKLVSERRIDEAVAAAMRARSSCKSKEFEPRFDGEVADLKALGELEDAAARNMELAGRVTVTWKGRETSGSVKERSGKRVTISRDKVEFPVEMSDLAPADILKYAGCHGEAKLAAKATAYLAMRGDVGEAFKWIEKVEDEPEKARLALKLEALSKGAEQAVVDHMMDGIRKAFAEKDWNDVRSRVAALAAKFGATEPCRKAQPEMDRILLETAEAESGGLTSFIHGKVRKLDGLRVEIRYDFLSPAEYGDWLKMRGSGSREPGGLAIENNNDACARPFMKFESVETFEFDGKNVSDRGQHLGWSLGDERNPYVGAWGWLRPNGDSAIEAPNVKVGINPKIAPQKDTVYRMLIEVKGAVVSWTIDGKPVGQWDSKRQDLGAAYPYINVFSSKAVYSNIRIVGTLDRAWTEKQFAISKLCKEQDLVQGLIGEYWNGNEAFAGKPTASRRDQAVDFDWGNDGPIGGVGGDGFCARFSGKLYVETAGDYTFNCESDDGARVFLDGKPVWEGWGYRGGWQQFEVKGLTAGLHDIKVEMHEGVGGARCRLDWESKDLKRGRMPAEVFFCSRKTAEEISGGK